MGIGYALGTLVLALVHVLGRYLNPQNLPHRRRWISVAAGVSVAYVFVDMLPLMAEKEEAFLAASAGEGLLARAFRVHVAALVGFLWFYGLEHFVGSRQETPDSAGEAGAEHHSARPMHWLHVGGFAFYNLMMGYLLIEWSKEAVGLALYCGALGLHFLITGNGMRRDYGANYDRVGRWVMAICVVAGALLAFLTPLPIGVLTIVVGLVAGGVVINSVKDEMPIEGGGRFLPFVLGALAYATLVIFASRLEGG
jgi:hypothetical protein